jgi:hypothetical protein
MNKMENKRQRRASRKCNNRRTVRQQPLAWWESEVVCNGCKKVCEHLSEIDK